MQCLSIIFDKSIIGGVVNRVREILEVSGERARDLRALNKSRGERRKVDESGKQAFRRQRRRKQRKQESLAERPWPATPPLPGLPPARRKAKKSTSAPPASGEWQRAEVGCPGQRRWGSGTGWLR